MLSHKKYWLPVFMVTCFALLSGCAHINLVSQWTPHELRINLSKGTWAQTIQVENQDFLVEAMNDDTYLYLFLATNSDRVKSQLLGAFHQKFTLWFDPGRQGKYDTGLDLIFHRKPGVSFPKTDSEEKEYWAAATHELTLLAPGQEGYPRSLPLDSTEVDWQSDMENGKLVYALKIPLHQISDGTWSIGAEPGQRLQILMQTSAIDPQAAFLELVREYQDEAYGWGWDRNGYGPGDAAKAMQQGKVFGLGDYDDWNLDNSIYATHGIYNHLSWASVPDRIDLSVNLLLASSQAGDSEP
jgi:hypothetical protein